MLLPSAPVLRLPLRSYLALLLLLCLTRMLLPEAWVLTLHSHEHTKEEPTFVVSCAHAKPSHALLTAKHVHCQTEQFYNVPFQKASLMAMTFPHRQLNYRRLAVPATLANSVAVLRRTALRGPPVS